MNSNPKNASKQGIALIIVIGFLSILLILAVAFVVSMRTESLATRGYVDNIKTRQLVNVALARAMDDIEQNLQSNALVYPKWGAYGSVKPSGFVCTGLLEGTAIDYVPNSLVWSAQQVSADVRWQNISNLDGRVVGRYAYLAVDCSGFLDANWIGGLSRAFGTNTFEISPDNTVLSELEANPNNANLWTERNSRWVRYESVPELYRLGITAPFFIQSGKYPSDLFTYSYFSATQFLDGAGQVANALYIGDLANVQGNRDPIRDRFIAMGLVLPGQAAAVARNLIDYLDTDYEPGNGAGLEDFCTEPVPMINEVVISNTVVATTNDIQDVYTNQIDVTVELWYPFVGHDNPNDYTVEVVMWTVGGTVSFGWPTFITLRAPLSGPWNGGSSRREVVNLSSAKTFPTAYGGSAPALPGVFLCEVKIREGNMASSGVLVDKLKQFGTPWATFGTVVPTVGAAPSHGKVEKEANDPRINWMWGSTVQWQPTTDASGHTLGNPNTRLTYAASSSDDGNWYMYVRNSNYLYSVGELGFLLYDTNKPWRTISLLTTNALPVLDYFTLVTNAYQKGLVNPNTPNTNAMIALLLGAPAERWPWEGGAALSQANAQLFASAFKDGRMYTNLSDIARATNGLPVLDNQQLEGVIRNSVGILGTRQNLYTIFLAAQAVDSATNVAGEQRAVAVVWRDPLPITNPNPPPTQVHEAFIRFFKWLTE